MKELWESRTVWTGGVLTALGAFLLYLQSAPAGTFPAWVPYTAGGLVPLLGAVVVALRVQDKRNEPQPQPVVKPTVGEVLARKPVTGADMAHPRCQNVTKGHRCIKPEGHSGEHSTSPDWR